MTLKEKQLVFLNDTVGFYNSSNRCVNEVGRCKYAPTSDKTPGCAIGRHLPSKLQNEFDNLDFSGVSVVFDLLPEKLKELGEPFLISIQALHDRAIYWNEDGLSDFGLHEYNEIKAFYRLN